MHTLQINVLIQFLVEDTKLQIKVLIQFLVEDNKNLKKTLIWKVCILLVYVIQFYHKARYKKNIKFKLFSWPKF